MKQTNLTAKKPSGRILHLNGFEMVRSFMAGNGKNQKSTLTRPQKELFNAFYEEHQRLYRIAEINYFKKHLSEQRKQVNEMTSYLKKRNLRELKTYGRLPVMISSIKEKQLQGAPVNKFKITNDILDLKRKVIVLDNLFGELRSFIGYYEVEDYKRWDMKNGGGFDERMSRMIRKKLRKVA